MNQWPRWGREVERWRGGDREVSGSECCIPLQVIHCRLSLRSLVGVAKHIRRHEIVVSMTMKGTLDGIHQFT